MASEGEHEGDDMEYVGRVDPSVPGGPVDLSEYELPQTSPPTA